MEKKKVLKRLYVGRLGHTVSKAELQERFSKFGNVTDSEIVIRKDDQGNTMKTFAYINISISEADLKRCMSILNKPLNPAIGALTLAKEALPMGSLALAPE
uniref:RRM domain-containing protein n=1 Tax=Gopherus agassizii TaxID=38772 RepID=A0A452GM28_9SAUR